MRKLNIMKIFLIGLLFITLAFSSLQEAASSNVDIQTVGYDISDFEDDGEGTAPGDPGDLIEGGNSDVPSPENPDEYDPENPYGQWE